MRRATHGGVTLPVSLDARGATRELIQLAGQASPRPVTRLRSLAARNESALLYPATGSLVGQRGDRLSEMLPPGSGWAAEAGLFISGQGNSPSHSFKASSRRADNRSGLSSEELRLRGLAAETMTPHSLSLCSALKLSQVADTTFNIASGLLIAFFIILYFLSPFIALGCLIIA